MRKTLTVEIEADNRDKGKMFLIQEMPADKAERWATRAFFALLNAKANIPDDMAAMGMAGMAEMGLEALSGVPYEAAEPLLDALMECVEIIPNPAQMKVHRTLIDTDIEEVSTRFRLKKEVFDLHTGFFTSGALSISE